MPRIDQPSLGFYQIPPGAALYWTSQLLASIKFFWESLLSSWDRNQAALARCAVEQPHDHQLVCPVGNTGTPLRGIVPAFLPTKEMAAFCQRPQPLSPRSMLHVAVGRSAVTSNSTRASLALERRMAFATSAAARGASTPLC